LLRASLTVEPQRPIRSYVRREGRITSAQRRALAELWPVYVVDLHRGPVDTVKLFGRNAVTILEIGFGNGEVLANLAAQNPEHNHIGVEVHRPGVGSLLLRLERDGIGNVRVFAMDVQDVMERGIPKSSLDRVLIFFPDPWPKKRHHKRRLIQSEFLSLVVSRLKFGGDIHIATDCEDYARQIMALAAVSTELETINSVDCLSRVSHRPNSKYERRSHSLGHRVWDMRFRRRGAA